VVLTGEFHRQNGKPSILLIFHLLPFELYHSREKETSKMSKNTLIIVSSPENSRKIEEKRKICYDAGVKKRRNS